MEEINDTPGATPAPLQATVAVETHEPLLVEDGHSAGPLQFAWPMFFWFLTVFVIAFAILRKFAWGPILAGLDKREATLQESLENAERLRAEMARLEATCQQKLDAADRRSQEILEQARKGAREAGLAIEHKAREESKILLENARREIAFSTQQAQAALRKEAADTAAALAAKILGETLDPARQAALTDRLIREV